MLTERELARNADATAEGPERAVESRHDYLVPASFSPTPPGPREGAKTLGRGGNEDGLTAFATSPPASKCLWEVGKCARTLWVEKRRDFDARRCLVIATSSSEHNYRSFHIPTFCQRFCQPPSVVSDSIHVGRVG